MDKSKLRRQIAWEAARMMYDRHESEYYRAKMKAARRICKGWVKPSDLPSNGEIRDQIQLFARITEGDARKDNLKQMRLEALRYMKMLTRYHPKLIGSVLTGHIRAGSDIDLHIFADNIDGLTTQLEEECIIFDVEKKRVRKQGEERVFTHIHVQDEFPIEITVYPVEKRNYVFKSSVTGKAMERVSIAELESFLTEQYSEIDLAKEMADLESRVDRYQYYESLLLPLENVKQDPRFHPEGDALYHSLQVFDLACDNHPYDEEFLVAALMHDVGKAIDPYDHVAAGIDALHGFATTRTLWLIEHHMIAHKIADRTIGARAHRRLRENESYDELVLLSQIDKAGRKSGIETTELEDAVTYLRGLMSSFN